MTFYENEDYTGKIEIWTRNEANLQENSIIGKIAKGFCVSKGVWMVNYNLTIGETLTHSCTPSPDDSGVIMDSVLINSNIGMICFSLHDEEKGQSAVYTSIRHLASNNLDEPSLSLYEERWRGSELQLTGNSIKLPTAVEVTTFAYTGLESWTLFSGVEHSGDSFCLPSGWGASNPGLTGVSFGDNIPLQKIGSASLGCNENLVDVDDDPSSSDVQIPVTFLSCPEVMSKAARYVQLQK